ncbi:YppG family protein [Litchfieldia salsa]|uniref:YppG-like protein n=1 Tax=Litchfieldia salsa TaxID=930152 RepID=A0A1H0TJA6_9BACI|nr:YppG family protein [Litchfieldia salsa]SDP54147.1 YppG-like protein [Litchfieldia salsa]
MINNNRTYTKQQLPHGYYDYHYPSRHQRFMNPNMTTQQYPQMNYNQQNMGYPFANGNFQTPFNNQLTNQQGMYPQFQAPYPVNNQMPTGQPTGIQSFMSQFKAEDGTYDYNKMMDTAGQMMGAVNQVSGLVKGISSVFKS